LGNKLGLDINLCDDSLISSEHAKIFIDKDGYFIKDLNSVRGTYLNREKIIERTKLTYGDLITIGKTILQFKVDRLKEKSRF
jgi:pSer/pThr/pTyr-binding forkhead associated (FHA) protein